MEGSSHRPSLKISLTKYLRNSVQHSLFSFNFANLRIKLGIKLRRVRPNVSAVPLLYNLLIFPTFEVCHELIDKAALKIAISIASQHCFVLQGYLVNLILHTLLTVS